MPLNEHTAAAQKALNEMLSGAASNHDQLRRWALANMADVGTGLVAGSIVWDKALGKPSTQKLCDGFTITLSSSTLVTPGTPGDGGGVETWIHSGPMPMDKKWDDSNGERYIVHFLTSKPSCHRLSMAVVISDGVDWLDASGVRSPELTLVSPSERDYGLKLLHPGIPSWIEPFGVIRARDSIGVYRVP